jgi:lactoylglutathione lyase
MGSSKRWAVGFYKTSGHRCQKTEAKRMELIHTCYRITTSTARSPSTRRSASRSARGCRSARRRSTSSWGCPADGDRLELTYNFGVDSYEIGTGYGHIAITVDDMDGDARRARGAGDRARAAQVPGARGRLVHRFVRDPDGYRVELIERSRT